MRPQPQVQRQQVQTKRYQVRFVDGRVQREGYNDLEEVKRRYAALVNAGIEPVVVDMEKRMPVEL